MMNFNMTDLGFNGGGIMTFVWIFHVLLVVLVVFGIAALWKYISKK